MNVKWVPKRIQIEIKSSFYNFLIFLIFFTIYRFFYQHFPLVFYQFLYNRSLIGFSRRFFYYRLLPSYFTFVFPSIFGTFHQFVYWFRVGCSTGRFFYRVSSIIFFHRFFIVFFHLSDHFVCQNVLGQSVKTFSQNFYRKYLKILYFMRKRYFNIT